MELEQCKAELLQCRNTLRDYINWLNTSKKQVFNLELENITLKEELKRLKEKQDIEEPLELTLPKIDIKGFEAVLSLVNKTFITALIEYLNTDSFELVKSTMSIIDWNNQSEVIAFRNWALKRNESLIKILKKYEKEKEGKISKINWVEL